jgi:ABC-type transport system substrate-binding protein/PKD repeat protein
MEGNSGRATKTTIFAAVFLAFVMLGMPTLSTSGSFSVADNASAVAGDRALRIGIVGMTGSISTLNPLLYTMAEEMFVIWPCYSFMFQYDENTKEIGDLVKSYTTSPDGLTWNFKLVDTAVFYDKNRAALSQPMIPLTARDIIFTFNMIANETTNNLASYFPKVNGNPIIQSITQGATAYDLRIVLSSQYAPFVSGALHSIPILPRYIWINHYDPPNHKNAWNWDNFGTGEAPLVGSGFYYYGLAGLPSTNVVELIKSPTWFEIEEHGWDMRVDKLVLRSETSADSNLADMQSGVIDVMEWVSPDQYTGVLSTLSGTTRFASSTGFVYEYNLNQMTDAFRSQLGGKYGTGANNQLLLDPIVKQAIAMSVDKQEFIDVTYQGLGSPADSLVPYAHPYHYAYGLQPSEGGRAPLGEEAIPYDPVGARAMLMTAGWKYRQDGSEILSGAPDFATYYPLCKQGATSPLKFHFWTLSESAEWNIGGRLLIDYAKAVGVDLEWDYQLKTTNDMNGIWASADYDMWLWDWVFTPVSEVSVDVLEVMTTASIGSWSDIFWSDPTYDSLYNQSLVQMDPVARMALTDSMQRIAYENMGCQLLAYRADLFAARTNGPDNWQNWGDWSTKWLLEPSQLSPWLYLRIEPQDNNAPDISTQATYDAVVGTGLAMTASATDNNNLEYRWFYGDGTKSSWQPSAATSHTYTKDGYYTAYVAARETNSLDFFTTVTQTTVKAVDLSNTPPTGVDFSFSPSNPDSGTIVHLYANATDQAGDTLYYSWNFGDGSIGTGQNTTHQFTNGVTSSVTLSVDDHHLGTGTRPVNVTKLVPVTANSPPTISVPSNPAVTVKKSTSFTVSWGDVDARDSHRFTWLWGDGSTTVTTTNTASHSYANKGVKTMTVWIDDLTNLPGHNVSGVGLNTVVGVNNKNPAISVPLAANVTSTYTGWPVSFSVTATDADLDMLGFTFEFGDGEYAFDNITAPATATAVHTYAVAGFYDAYVTVTDYQAAPLTSGPETIEVLQGNRAPVVDRPSPGSFMGTVGSPIGFHGWANDSDGNPLTFWWDFGDGEYGTGLTPTHTYLSSSGPSGFSYRVWVDDGHGANVSSLPSVAVLNAVPTLPDLPLVKTGASEIHNFTGSASDEDLSDTLTYTWNFGDGTGDFEGAYVLHSFATAPANYTYTVTVDDGFVDGFGVSHIVSKTGTVTVYPFALHLVAGWNMVTIPTILNGYKAGNIGLKTGDVVSGYNPATKTYDKNFIVGVSPPPLDFAIAGSTGYWVNAGTDETLYLYGTIPTTPQTRSITLQAGGGWFTLGFNTLKTTMKASNIPGMYAGGSVSTVAWYNPVTGIYKTYIAGVPPTDFTLVPGQAYWVYASASGTLTYTP